MSTDPRRRRLQIFDLLRELERQLFRNIDVTMFVEFLQMKCSPRKLQDKLIRIERGKSRVIFGASFLR